MNFNFVPFPQPSGSTLSALIQRKGDEDKKTIWLHYFLNPRLAIEWKARRQT
jgi:hypothetical protein